MTIGVFEIQWVLCQTIIVADFMYEFHLKTVQVSSLYLGTLPYMVIC